MHHHLDDHPIYIDPLKCLITIWLVSPLNGAIPPFIASVWLINTGDPSHFLSGMILQVRTFHSCWCCFQNAPLSWGVWINWKVALKIQALLKGVRFPGVKIVLRGCPSGPVLRGTALMTITETWDGTNSIWCASILCQDRRDVGTLRACQWFRKHIREPISWGQTFVFFRVRRLVPVEPPRSQHVPKIWYHSIPNTLEKNMTRRLRHSIDHLCLTTSSLSLTENNFYFLFCGLEFISHQSEIRNLSRLIWLIFRKKTAAF